LTDEDREKVRRAFERYAGEGLRVLGFAERKVPGPDLDEERDGAESHLTFLGLAALEDPPRPDVAEAVFPLLVWGTDEVRRWILRRRGASEEN
jgi:magnesium-transporting ATPase (P-type)